PHVAAVGPDALIGTAPHSLRAVTPEMLREITRLRPEAPIHLHIAEQEAEVTEIEAAYGARPVAWLMDHLEPDRRWCLIHATQMVPGETAALAASGAVAGLCPITEANLGDGIFDGARFAEAGGAFGVGTDSNIQITLAGELRQLEYSQRLRDRERVILAGPRSTGRTLYEGACRGGAQALGRGAGAIEPGAWADLVALDGAALDLAGLGGDTLLDAWIFTGCRAVRDVWSAGRHVVREGRHIAGEPIRATYRATMTKLRETL
ncbi:MAG: amidohydrolase family protein, partial [Pseudomonadota bacterium]